MIPKSILGKTGARVTILGLGGEGLLRTYNYEKEAKKCNVGTITSSNAGFV